MIQMSLDNYFFFFFDWIKNVCNDKINITD